MFLEKRTGMESVRVSQGGCVSLVSYFWVLLAGAGIILCRKWLAKVDFYRV